MKLKPLKSSTITQGRAEAAKEARIEKHRQRMAMKRARRK